jgi:hypothetical protein
VKQGVREELREDFSTFRDFSNTSIYLEIRGDGTPVLMMGSFYPDHGPMKGCVKLTPVDEGRGHTLTYFEFEEAHFSDSI